MGKALRMGLLDPIAGDVLRELSRKELLGEDLMIIGSTGPHLYEAVAGTLLPRSLIVEGDLDLMSSAESRQEAIDALLPVLRLADKSFTLHGPSRSMQGCPGE